MLRIVFVITALVLVFCDSGKDDKSKTKSENDSLKIINNGVDATTEATVDSTMDHEESVEDDSIDVSNKQEVDNTKLDEKSVTTNITSIDSIDAYLKMINECQLTSETINGTTFEPEAEYDITIYKKENEIVKIQIVESFYPGEITSTFYYHNEIPIMTEIIRYDKYVKCIAEAEKTYYDNGIIIDQYGKEVSDDDVETALQLLKMENYDLVNDEKLHALEAAKVIMNHAKNNTIKSEYLNY